MIELTDFQEVAGLALDIPDKDAALIQKGWPKSERDLRSALKLWRTVSSSQISGRDILLVCAEVWRQRPEDLEMVEGRTILYHPADGSPIPQGSPLDNIPAETLAFLKWSLDKGFLRWTDEVTIAREVKEAGNIIADLPRDRFYGKNTLPYLSDGKIDWGNLGLAAAKDFICNGQKVTKLEILAPMYGADGDTLEGVLSSISMFRDSMTRDRLLKNLPGGACGAISRSSAPAIDIGNIVMAVEGFGRLTTGQLAINVLIENAISLVAGTAKARKLEQFKK